MIKLPSTVERLRMFFSAPLRFTKASHRSRCVTVSHFGHFDDHQVLGDSSDNVLRDPTAFLGEVQSKLTTEQRDTLCKMHLGERVDDWRIARVSNISFLRLMLVMCKHLVEY